MSFEMRVWRDGRITIPKKLREKYGLLPGKIITLVGTPEGLLVLRKIKK